MQILYSTELFYPPLGGAEYSTIKLCEQLANKHDVNVVFLNKQLWLDGKRDLKINNYSCNPRFIKQYDFKYISWFMRYTHLIQWKKVIEKEIKIRKPDLLITHMRFTAPSIEIATKYNVPTIIFIHYYGHFCPIQFEGKDPFECDENCKKCLTHLYDKVQIPIIKYEIYKNIKAIQSADIVIAVSQYVADVVEKFTGVKSDIIPPFMDFKDTNINLNERTHIFFTPPAIAKGLCMVLKIADVLKDEKFLITGKQRGGGKVMEEIKKRDNIEYIPWVKDIHAEIYSRTKLTLMPSMWPEPFGMVAVESQMNGIPVVASNIGALPEVVGDGGIVVDNYKSVDSWINAIRQFDDMEFYNMTSNNAINNANKFKHYDMSTIISNYDF